MPDPAGPWTQYAKTSTAPTDGPWSQYAEPAVDMRARNTPASATQSLPRRIYSAATEEQADDSSHGFLRSFYDNAVRPIAGMARDVWERGDFGEHAVGELIDSFSEQAKNFAAHPDIRNLPIVGTGATGTVARAKKQFEQGNYEGAAGTVLGFLGQFAAPELIKRPPGLVDLPEPVANGVRAAGDAAKDIGAGVKAAAPDLAKAGAKAATGVALHYTGLGPAADLVGLDVGVRGAGRSLAAAGRKGVAAAKASRAARLGEAEPLSPGEEILRSMRESNAERARIDASYESLPDGPEEPPDWFERYIQKPEHWEPGPTGTPAPAQHWEPGPADRPTWEPGPAGAPPAAAPWEPAPAERPTWEPGPPTPPAAAPWEPYRAARSGAPIDVQPDARASLPPDLAARVEELRAESHPELSRQQFLEDALDEHAARLQHQAEDIIWANRARKADRFAIYLRKNNLDPTPENLATAARQMGERAAPSDETQSMIQDRMNFQPHLEQETK